MELLIQRIQNGLLTFPTQDWWLITIAGGSLLIAVAMMLRRVITFTPDDFFRLPMKWWAIRILLVPVFAEELLFRGILLPHYIENPSPEEVLLAGTLATALYVTAHPLSAWLLRPYLLNLFGHPRFLFITTMLGMTNSLLYWYTGSLFPPIILHWGVVVGWRLLYQQQISTRNLTQQTSPN